LRQKREGGLICWIYFRIISSFVIAPLAQQRISDGECTILKIYLWCGCASGVINCILLPILVQSQGLSKRQMHLLLFVIVCEEMINGILGFIARHEVFSLHKSCGLLYHFKEFLGGLVGVIVLYWIVSICFFFYCNDWGYYLFIYCIQC